MLETSVFTAVWKIISPVVSPIIGYFTKRSDRRRQAAVTFRETIIRELKGLYPIPTEWPKRGIDIDPRLRKVFPALQVAVSTYRPYVVDKEGFDDAWLIYRTDTKRDIDQQSYHHYMNFGSTSVNAFGGETTIKQDGKVNFKHNVDRLLSFAQDV
jgi:hypothetical protein